MVFGKFWRNFWGFICVSICINQSPGIDGRKSTCGTGGMEGREKDVWKIGDGEKFSGYQGKELDPENRKSLANLAGNHGRGSRVRTVFFFKECKYSEVCHLPQPCMFVNFLQ